MSLRIARVSEYMVPRNHVLFGGMSANEFFLCKGLAQLGHDVTIFASNIPPGRYSQSGGERFDGEAEAQPGFRVIRSLSIADLGGDMPIMPLLAANMKRVSPDIIHAHENYNYSSIIAWAVARAKRVPFTYTQDRYYWVKRRLWRPFFGALNGSLVKSVRNTPRAVTAFSSAAADFLDEQGYPMSRISIIPLGVDNALFSPGPGWLRRLSGIDDGPLVLCVARLHPSKNLECLIRAFRIVAASSHRARLAIVGRGPLLMPLKLLISRLGLEKSVILLTRPVPYEKMAGLYNDSELLALPSLYEPFGMSILEAMSCGKPVVVSDVGGMRDTVIDRETGFRIPISDPATLVKTLASRISELIQHKDLAEKMGRAARERAQLLYSWDVIVRRYDEFYRTLVS